MRRSTLLAAVFFLITAGFMLRGVALKPASLLQANGHVVENLEQWEAVGHADQEMVLSLVARNADLLLSNPGALRGVGQCFPFPTSFTLGEHAFAEGVIAALPWALTGDPILSYNWMLFVGYFLSGFSMFLLARHFTGNAAAGILAGLFLQWVPSRIADGGHPYLHTEFWLAFALLFLHRLFVTGQVRAAFGVAISLGMQALGSFYLILGVIPVVGIYVPFLAWRHPHYRWRALGLTLLAGLAVGVVGLWVLVPYLETRDAWPVLGGRLALLLPISSLLPGEVVFSGWIFFGLILLGMVDRVRGRRSCAGEDPRVPMLLAAILIVLCSTSGARVPGTSIAIPSPLILLFDIVPGLDAVRALSVMITIAWVPLALIAAYGVLALLGFVGPRPFRWVFAVLVMGVAVIRFVPAVSEMTYGSPLVVSVRDPRPTEAEISLIREAEASAVLHLPMGVNGPVSDGNSSRQLLLGSFSPAPTTSCYNSFTSPYASQIGQLGRRLPAVDSIEALAAFGVDTVVLHKLDLQGVESMAKYRDWFQAKSVESPEVRSRIQLLGETDQIAVYRISAGGLPSSSEKLLHRGVAFEQQWIEGDSKTVRFWIRNRGNRVYLDPEPRGYRDGAVLWVDEQGAPILRESVQFLMPLALAPGARLGLDVAIDPPPGDEVYLGYLSPAGGEWKGIALARVRRVGAAEAEGPED